MELACTQEDGHILAACEGQLDETSNQAFRNSLHPLFSEPGVNVVVDISNVSRINSQGISAMVRLVADANTQGCRVIFAGPSPFVHEVLKVTRLDGYFEVTSSKAEAIESLRSDVRQSG